MVDKIGAIRNPLTIIAIFAAIAEISGTIVLPFISIENQGAYIWFLMAFPLLLVVLFFLTLNFNHKVLYAPSDFKNEDNFFKSLPSASPAERAKKFQEEAQEIKNEFAPEVKQSPSFQSKQEQPIHTQANQRDIGARYLLAEELVINKISNEMGGLVRRGVRFGTHLTFIFDGVIINDEKITAIEVKYIQNAPIIPDRFRNVFRSIRNASEGLPASMISSFSLILAVVTDEPSPDQKQLINCLSELIGATPFPVQVRVFSLAELKEFSLDI